MEIRPVGTALILTGRRTGRKIEGQTVGRIEGEADGCDEGSWFFSGLSETPKINIFT
jgi:hypothetical protein